MSSLDKGIRLVIEEIIDHNIENPKLSEEGFKGILEDLSIDPTIENILVFQCGNIYGQALRMSIRKYGKIRAEDETGTIEILKRRKNELRDAYMASRFV